MAASSDRGARPSAEVSARPPVSASRGGAFQTARVSLTVSVGQTVPGICWHQGHELCFCPRCGFRSLH